METFLNRLNLILIALVGTLVVCQWSGENRADRTIVALRASERALEGRVAEQAEALRRANEDLKVFKGVIGNYKTQADGDDAQIRQSKARIFVLERQAERGTAQAASLQRSLTAFKDAVAVRDGDIRTLLDQRRHLADAASDAARKANVAVTLYNDLAAKYESLVGQYNDLAKRYRAAANNAQKPPADAHS